MKKFIDILKESNYVIDLSATKLLEDLHPELKQVLDDDSYPAKSKISAFTKKTRKMISNGEDTGLENDKPKKGSSRAVWFPKQEKEITLDGQKTKLHTAVKVAFPGTLDKYTGDDRLLGEHQNENESSYFHQKHYAVLTPSDNHDGSLETNEHGVLAPVLDHHEDGHWLEMAKADKFDAKRFREATKTEDMPKGMTFKDFSDVLLDEHELSKGNDKYRTKHMSEEHYEKVLDHPFTRSVMDFCNDTQTHPADIGHVSRNMGIFRHPVTGKDHPVILDYGFNHDTAKMYNKARRNQMDSKYRNYY